MFLDTEGCEEAVLELDADSLVYRIGGAVDMQGEGKRFACKLIDTALMNMYEDLSCSRINIYLGTSTNYRIDVAKMYGYKANRKGKDRPSYYDAIRAWLVSKHDAILVDDEEAEDAVGIAAYNRAGYGKYIIGAIDKDMLMIAGHHYNYVKHTMQFIDEVQALRNFYCQLVTGDMTDNIPGLYHQLMMDDEKEKAHKFKYSRYKSKLIKELAECTDEKSMYEAALSRYKEQGQFDKHGICRILEIGQLLWIRRYEKEMWTPPCLRDWTYPKEENEE